MRRPENCRNLKAIWAMFVILEKYANKAVLPLVVLLHTLNTVEGKNEENWNWVEDILAGAMKVELFRRLFYLRMQIFTCFDCL